MESSVFEAHVLMACNIMVLWTWCSKPTEHSYISYSPSMSSQLVKPFKYNLRFLIIALEAKNPRVHCISNANLAPGWALIKVFLVPRPNFCTHPAGLSEKCITSLSVQKHASCLSVVMLNVIYLSNLMGATTCQYALNLGPGQFPQWRYSDQGRMQGVCDKFSLETRLLK